MTDVQATLFGAFIGGMIGVFGTYIGAIKIASRQRFIDAGERLREAFIEELATLRDPRQDNIDTTNILEKAFTKHLIAISEFTRRLPKCKHDAFNQAWQQYHCYPDPEPPCTHFLEQYSTKGGGIDEKRKNRNLAIERIEHILSFTE